MPPCLVFHGTKDRTVPYENAQRFVKLMKEAGNDCQLVSAVGEDHGFFNGAFFRKKNGDSYFNLTMYESDLFLQKNHWLKGVPNLKSEAIEVNVLGGNVVYGPRLNSEAYHEIRRGLKNSQVRFTRTKKGTVAFLGGSITYNKGWRNKVCAYLQERFPETKFNFIAAGIPSEGSTSGAFRLMQDVLSKGKIDLLFEEAAVNDRSPALRRNSKDRVRRMEGIVRHALDVNPKMDIVMMHFVDPSKMETYNKGKVPQEILDHDGVAKHYNITSINLAKEITERINAGEFNWKEDFRNLHPSPFGQNIYFQSMRVLLNNAYKENVKNTLITPYSIPEKLNDFAYDKGRFISFKEATFKKGWEIDPFWEPIKKERVRAGYTKIPLLVANEVGKTMKLKFKGSAIGMVALSGQDAGMIAYSIDGGKYKTFDLFTANSPFQHLPRYFMLAPELEEGKEHTLKIKLLKKSNAKSIGNACRIYSFFAN
jgi:sialidase-1